MKSFLLKIRKKYTYSIVSFLIFLLPWMVSAKKEVNEDPGFIVEALRDFMAFLFTLVQEIAAAVFYFSGMVFDNLLAITLSTSLFNADFIRVLWSNIRDLSNVVFILGMIFIAFSMMFNYGNWKKSLIALIVVAFALNFSLFFARVIVDAGNITANVFVSSISSKVDNPDSYFYMASTFYDGVDPSSFASVGAHFSRVLAPSNLLGAESFDLWQQDARAKGQNAELKTYILIQAVLIVFFLIFAKQLFTAGFMFLGRMIWIIYYMVAAPVFFVTAFIPGQGQLWKNKWLFPLLQKSFCVSIYLFFLWLSLEILSTDLVSGLTGGVDLYAMLGIFIIKGIFVIKVLKMGNKLAHKWCEDGSSTMGMVFGMAGKALAVTGVGKVGGAMARTAIGGVGKSMESLKIIEKLQSGNRASQFLGDRMALFGKGMQNIKVGKKSFVDDQNARMKMLREVEKDLGKRNPEALKQRRLKQLKAVDKVDGKIDLKKVSKIANESQHQALQRVQQNEPKINQAREELKKGKDADLAKTQLGQEVINSQEFHNILEQKAKLQGLDGVKKDQWIRTTKEAALNSDPSADHLRGDITSLVSREIDNHNKIKGNLKDNIKLDKVVFDENVKPLGLPGSFLASIMPAVKAVESRFSEDQETATTEFKGVEENIKKRERFRELSNEATNQKLEIDSLGETFQEALSNGDLNLAKESLDSLRMKTQEQGIFESMQKDFAEMNQAISELRDIELREEKLEDMKIFEDDDYRVGDSESSQKELLGKLDTLFEGGDQEKLKEIKATVEAIPANSGYELDPGTRDSIRKRYQEYVSQESSDISRLKSKRKKLNSKIKTVQAKIKGNIDAVTKFKKANILDQSELAGKQMASLVANQNENARIDSTGIPKESQTGDVK